MARPYRLFWSHVEDYEACPQKFLWGHGWEGVDLGAGEGKRKPKPVQDSRHSALMGLVIGSGLERLYNDEMYRDPKNLAVNLEAVVRKEFAFALSKEYVDWNRSPSRTELLEVCLKGIRGFLDTMKTNRLLGPYARSEVYLDAWVDDYTPVSGRPDLIIRRDDEGVAIYDGKNSLNPGDYTDPDQLRWYALCFYLKHKVLPTKLGFVYFRYPPTNPPPKHKGPWNGISPVELNRDHLRDLGSRAQRIHLAMAGKKFDPTPSASACRWCDYRTVCSAVHVPKSRAAAPQPIEPGSVEETLDSSSGIVELGLRAAPPPSRT